MTDTLTASELRFDRILPAPVETVWRYLTDDELRARWFMGGDIEPRVGGRIGFVFDHDRLSDDAVPMPEKYAANRGASWHEEIVRFEPPHVLAFTFGSGSDTLATFELSALDDGRTRLTLVHSGIGSREQAANFGGGWTSHLAVLEAKLNGGGVPDFWALHRASEAKVAAALAEA